jgi:predicted transcriptional regulator
MEFASRNETSQLTAQIISSYVTNNKIEVAELQKLILDIHTSLTKAPNSAADSIKVELNPAVAIKKSVTPDYIVCLEDGLKFKSLKRHLAGAHGLTPKEYRTKWDLPRDYPIVAPNYAQTRSLLAKRIGLGLKSTSPPAKKTTTRARRKRIAKKLSR